MAQNRVLFRSAPIRPGASGVQTDIAPARAGWRYVHFAVRQLAAGDAWSGSTAALETCFVLLRGSCHVDWTDGRAGLGPRRDVFSGYPHALYLPPRTEFRVRADEECELADCRARPRRRFPARIIRPQDCGYEIRGGGNATRQIVDIMPPAFPADRLMICEVFTPSGNWSSYPPHKHDVDRPPGEVKLEEIYYYRFNHPDAYGFQRLYDGPPPLARDSGELRRGSPKRQWREGGRSDRTLTVTHGDVVLIRSGYHPFVSAYGYDAYYLNVLAGTRRSMAASDDPRYAAFRRWPAPDPRLPLVEPPT